MKALFLTDETKKTRTIITDGASAELSILFSLTNLKEIFL